MTNTHIPSRSLSEIISRTRAAVIQASATDATAPAAPAAPVSLTKWQGRTRADNCTRAASLPRLGVPVSRTAPPPLPRVLATFQDVATVQAGRVLSKGERALFALLHRLALDVGRERGYTHTPHAVAFHCPALTIAGALGVSDRYIRTLAAGLERAGLLDYGGHAQRVGLRSLYDGTCWSVLTVPSAEPPRLRADDWRAVYRPDFEADVLGKTGAAAECSELLSKSATPEAFYRAAKTRAVAQTASRLPAGSSSEQIDPANFRSVLEGIGGLWRLHSSKRPRAVGRLASLIAGALLEPDRRRYWCGVLWEAIDAQDEHRAGGLQALAAQFDRLTADIRENAPWRSPGAVLAARLKGAKT